MLYARCNRRDACDRYGQHIVPPRLQFARSHTSRGHLMAAERSQRPRTCGCCPTSRGAVRPSIVAANVSRILEQQRRQSAGLIVCLHEGHVLYQPADGRTRHVMHGDRDRAWQTLNVLFRWRVSLAHGRAALPSACTGHSVTLLNLFWQIEG